MKISAHACRRILTSSSLSLFIASGLGLASHRPAQAAALDADDYSAGALPAGTNLGLLYLQYSDDEQYNVDGHKALGGDLEEYIGILRYAHFVKIGSVIADPQFLLPFGYANGTNSQSGLGHSSGIGDLILASTFWLYNDPSSGHYFGVTPFIYMPTGQYNPQRPLNLGSNRWTFDAQAAYVTPLFTKNLVMQVSADISFYTPNNDYSTSHQQLTQAPEGEFQEWFMYHVNPNFDLRGGLFQTFGGTQKVDGVSVANSHVNTFSFKAGFGWNFTPNWNLVGLYGRDVNTQNGFQNTNAIDFRIMRMF